MIIEARLLHGLQGLHSQIMKEMGFLENTGR